MAVLSDNARATVHSELMQRISEMRQSTTLSKSQWRTLVNDLDAYLNTNAAAINTAISQPTRGDATTSEKALALMYVVSRRYLDGA